VCLSNSEVDIFQLLTWSGLLDILDAFGFQVQIKRAARGAQIRLGIDRNICPTVNSYELSVGREQVYIVAADSAGLLYGVYTLIQLMKLHSDIQASGMDPTASRYRPSLSAMDPTSPNEECSGRTATRSARLVRGCAIRSSCCPVCASTCCIC
jgi:hypothetical protein